ncbi:carbamate kinase [Vallitalea longa]|uniref:Carbamate kinase n=1 Tax=Vallitalea longa TaxID=2936439 RepID=A0A9W6DFZ8_9FIRM|nr:carbamate kinase [Vallitalea longa]GKX31095.1 carbamate kinase [Vallitalea longa]
MHYKNALHRIVIALGGNALGTTPEEQQEKISKAAEALVELIAQGNEIIISHGNGPQVGMINLAFEEASKVNDKVVPVKLPECTAMSQGYIGYHLQKGIKKELTKKKMPWHVATVVTQIIVDKDDEAFNNPTKPIGGYYTKEEATELMEKDKDLIIKEDAGRGYRKMVASPKPVDLVEKESIINMLDNEFIVIACGGGGIPVVKDGEGDFKGVEAVIDKDYASAKLADTVDADYLFILTAVDNVCLNYGKPNEKSLSDVYVEEAEKYIEEGHFSAGSMLPKVKAAMEFVKGKEERRAVIASLKNAPYVIKGESGTVIHS